MTREQDEMQLLVTAINDYEMRGRVNGDFDETTWLPFDGIALLSVQRLSMRRTLLRIVLPVVAGAVIACNNTDCRTRGTVTVTR